MRLFNLWELDQRLFGLVNGGWHAPWLDAVAWRLSYPPFPGLWMALAAGALIALRGRTGLRVVLLAVLAVGVADLLGGALLKPGIDRLRPCFALPDVRLLVPHQAHSPSFPSNHAANCFAAATILGSLGLRAACGWYAVAVLVAFSRVYLGVHYPLDVIGGAALGLGVGRGILALPRWFVTARSSRETKRPKTKA